MSVAPVSELPVVMTGCGLVDRSERGKLALTGPEAAGLLTGQVSNDIEALVPGTGCEATLLTNKGKLLGELRVLRTEAELHLDCERVALQALFDRLRLAGIGWQAELHKRTVQEGLLSLLGPTARDVAGVPELGLDEHVNAAASVAGIAVRAVATDVGLDLLCAAADTDALRSALEQAGALAVSWETAELVRVTGGRPRYGIDLDETVIPQEAGLNARTVSFTKGCYVGQETVARLHWRGKPNRHLRGLRLEAPVPEGSELVSDAGKVVGRATSVVAHPELGVLALALLRREVEPGDTIHAGETPARVVELPFVAAG